MKTELENIDLHIIRQGIDLNIARAMYFHDTARTEIDTRSFHLQERLYKTAVSFYDAAYAIMIVHGPLYKEYIDHPDWITLRRLKRKMV